MILNKKFPLLGNDKNIIEICNDLFSKALVFFEAGKMTESLLILKEIINNDSKHIDAIRLSGIIYFQSQKYTESIIYFKQLTQIIPTSAKYLYNLGAAYQADKNFEFALESYSSAIILQPDYVAALSNIGVIKYELGNYNEAINFYNIALSFISSDAVLHFNKAVALISIKDYEKSLASLNNAIELNPNYFSAYSNRGNVLKELGHYEKALKDYNYSIKISPTYSQGYFNKGIALLEMKLIKEALDNFELACSYKENYSEALFSKSLCLFHSGKIYSGFQMYECRWSQPELIAHKREFNVPLWLGDEPLIGKIILLHCEQGLGDTIQFCRYVKQVSEAGAKVVFEVQRPLFALLQSLKGVDQLIARGDPLPKFDFHCPLMSLPLAFKTSLSTIPNTVPYLFSSESKVQQWKNYLGDHGFKIAISWQGNPQSKADVGRSFPVELFREISHLPGVRLISLQKNFGAEQLSNLTEDFKVETLPEDFDSDENPFLDSAAVLKCVDLVISSDTALTHLAGALGVKAWLPLKYVPDWRWMLDSTDSPWYPNHTLFRQATINDWNSVFTIIYSYLLFELNLDYKFSSQKLNNVISSDLSKLHYLINSNKIFDAISILHNSLLTSPSNHNIYYLLAFSYNKIKHNFLGLKFINKALDLKNNSYIYHSLKGKINFDLNDFSQSILSYNYSLKINPNQPDILYNIGLSYQNNFNYEKSLDSYRKALSFNPKLSEAFINSGNIYQKLKKPREAIISYTKAITLNPNIAEYHLNLGNILYQINLFLEATNSYNRAIQIKSDYSSAYSYKGLALEALHFLDDAIKSFDLAIFYDKNNYDAYWKKSLTSLLNRDLLTGFNLYEWRWAQPELIAHKREFNVPLWLGDVPLIGKTILLHCEQGLGDTIQFCRYVKQVSEAGAKVVFEVQRPLFALLQSLKGVDQLIARGDPLPKFDFHCPLMSLPLAFKTSLSTIPNTVPYLFSSESKVQQWKNYLGDHGFKIAISWQGNPQSKADVGRSFPVELFREISHLPGVRLISLQKNFGAEQLSNLTEDFKVETLPEDFDSDENPFLDSAAVLKCVDLVISSDTALTHLAGALGVKAWLPLKYVPDWRWMLDSTDSPWYPNHTLFRQATINDWNPVFAEIFSTLNTSIKN